MLREKLLSRLIRTYGFENPIVIEFARLCGDPAVPEKRLQKIFNYYEENPKFYRSEE